jgi:uncharacterized protein YqjF (DUF2071 family)
MSLERDAEDFVHSSSRTNVRFSARYRPTGPIYAAAKGTLDHFLTERYCLYARTPDGRLLRNEVHHEPWSLQPASADIRENSMLEPFGLTQHSPPALLHFSAALDVVVWDAEVVR